MRLDEIISENSSIIASGLEGKKLERFNLNLQKLKEYYEEKQIPNVMFKDIKDYLNSDIETSWEKLFVDNLLDSMKHDRQNQALTDVYYDKPQIHTFNSKTKKVNALSNTYPDKKDMLKFLSEVSKIAEMINFLKDKIVKRQPKPVEDLKAKYLAPQASSNAITIVREALLKVTNDTFEELKNIFYNSDMNKVKFYVSKNKELPETMRTFMRIKQIFDKAAGSPSITFLYDVIDDKTGKLIPNYKDIIMQRADQEAKSVQENFVIKNLKKLDSIIDKKNNFTKIETVGYDLNLSSLTGTFKLSFKDGSSFLAYNSVVWSRSVRGKEFMRFPLRFSNVIMPDGSAMGKPSEERMNTVFVGE